MWFGILGHLAVRRADGTDVPIPGPARRQVLAALLCRPGAIVTTATLIEDLWGSAPPRSALNTLRSHVVRLRAALDQGADENLLVTSGDGYRLDVAPADVDAGRFEALIEEAGRTTDPNAAIERYDCALALWRDEPYVEFGDAPFAVLERIRLTELRALARERRTDLALAAGTADELLGDLEQRVRVEPYRERGWEQLALALYRAGRQADALGACRRARQVLLDDLGVDPGPGLQTLEQRLLQQDPELLAAPPQPVTLRAVLDRCPYLGLAGYEEEDAALFVGRERLTAILASRLADQSVVVVTGASGVGKSSLVRAGLVPALHSGALPGSAAWRIEVRTPGPDVFAEDDQRRPDLLVLDQGEELFTSFDPAARDDLVHRLACYAEHEHGRLVLVLRSDFYARLADVDSLAPYAERAAVLVGPMRADELRRALVEPAARAGLRLEDELVETIMDDVAGQPEPLPLLSEAMVRTWARRTGDLLTLDAYEQAGELAGALEAAAEECYASLDEAQQHAARRLLVRLATRGDTGWVRRPVLLADSIDEVERQALSALIAARLVVADERRIEISHEALLAHWPRLRDWLDERSLAADLLHHLDQAATEWRTAGRQDSDLYRGPRLSAALDWRTDHPEDLSPAEHEFLDASAHAADAELHAARARTRRLRAIVAVLAVVVLVAAGAAMIALRERSSANRSATVALANSLGGQAVGEPRLDLAMLLAVEGERLHPSPQTQGALLRTVLRAPTVVRTYYGDDLRVNGMALSPDGRTLALEDNIPNIFFIDTATGRRIGEVPSKDIPGAPSPMGFTSDGKLLLFDIFHSSDLTPNDIDVIDPSTARVTRRLTFPKRVLDAVRPHDDSQPAADFGGANFTFADGGRRLAAAVGGYVVQWTMPQGRIAAKPFPVADSAGWVFYTPDGRRLVVLGDNRTTVLDAGTGRVVQSYPAGGSVAGLAPDAKTFAIGDGDGNLHFLDLSTGAVVESTSAHPGGVDTVDFTPDGKRVITGGQDGIAREWDVATHQVVQTFTGHAGNIVESEISADGSTYYAGSSDGTVLAWDLTGTRGLATTFRAAHYHPQFSAALAFSPDAGTAAVGGTNGTVTVWNLHPLHKIETFPAVHGIIPALSFSPDGRSLLVAGDSDPGGGSLRVWRLRPIPHVVLNLHGFWRNLWAAYSPDGKVIADTGTPADAVGGFAQGGHGDGQVAEWSAATGKLLAPPIRLHRNGEAYAAGFADHGTTLAVAQLGDWAALVDPAHHRVLRRWKASSAEFLVGAALSPDGTRLATADWDGYLKVWDAATGKPALPTIRVSDGNASSVNWSPDGSRLVSSGGDGTVRLFDAGTGQQIGSSITIPSDSPGATFSPDGRTIGVYDFTGRVWIYPATVAGWAAYACRVANRSMTHAEWSKYVPGHPYQKVCP